MIKALGQVMLYVEDQEQSVKFWTDKLGFTVISTDELVEGYRSVEVAAGKHSETSLVIFDKAFIKKYSPELNLGTPSLMFKADNIDELYEEYQNKGINVGEKTEYPLGKVFNFSDDEGNYFAVSNEA